MHLNPKIWLLVATVSMTFVRINFPKKNTMRNTQHAWYSIDITPCGSYVGAILMGGWSHMSGGVEEGSNFECAKMPLNEWELVIKSSPNSIMPTLRQSPGTFPRTLPVLCLRLNSILARETDLSRTLSQHLDMSKCQDGLIAQNLPVTYTFHGLCPVRDYITEISLHHEIWALPTACWSCVRWCRDVRSQTDNYDKRDNDGAVVSQQLL